MVRNMTTDGYEYVLVQTDNDIRMISLSGGKDLGCLMRDGDQGLGRIYHIRWCNTTSSLIVANEVNDEYHISTIQFA